MTYAIPGGALLIETKMERATSTTDSFPNGKPGEQRKHVKQTAIGPFRTVYEWHEKNLHSEAGLRKYLDGGWRSLGGLRVGLWVLMYCGHDRVESANVEVDS